MDAIDTRTIEQDGHTYRIAVYADVHAPNPLEDWDEIGTILSLNRRHRNFDPAGIDAAIESNPDAVPLSYYEHGLCLWSVSGELPAAALCRWDSVSFAGLWLPDALTLESARNYGGQTRRHFMRKRARQACEAYTQWCNGDIYGYTLERLLTCDECGAGTSQSLDSCWGFFGLDACLSAATVAASIAGVHSLQRNHPRKDVSMTKLNIQHNCNQPDRVYVTMDNRFDVALIRTEAGLRIEVYPMTDGALWDDPVERFEVNESDILSLEQEMYDE